LSADRDLFTRDLIALLAHCPNVERLHIRGFINPDDSSIQFKLPNLLVLHITNGFGVPFPFATELIKTPNLQEIKVEGSRWEPCNNWGAFFSQNPGITKLTMPGWADFVKQMHEASNVQDLTVSVERSSDNRWLLELADAKRKRSSEGEEFRICPNLRTIAILFESSSTAPAYSFFKNLMKSRCVPTQQVNNELYTKTGYKALELLVLRFLTTEAAAIKLVESNSWAGAEVMKVCRGEGIEYCLSWSYRNSDVGDY
jgi:hypothetical protein